MDAESEVVSGQIQESAPADAANACNTIIENKIFLNIVAALRVLGVGVLGC